ncbi:MAG: SipW-dependent-type signal peptide-containing protein [Halobacteriales archaeon]
MSDKKIGLSRRQLMGGLGAAGIASAGAGLGTNALFSDEELFEENALTAGTLDLEVEITLVDVSGSFDLAVADASSLSSQDDTVLIDGDQSADADGDQVTAADLKFTLEDVKPGDWWVWEKCIRVDGNPAYVNQTADPDAPDPDDTDADGDPELASNENTNAENGQSEPETDSDSTTGPGSGELGAKLRVRTGDDYGGGDGVGGNGLRGQTNTGTPISLDGDEDITFSGMTSLNPLDLFFQGTLNHALWALSADMIEKDASGNPVTDSNGNFVKISDPDVGTLGAAPWNGLTLSDPIDRGSPGSTATQFEESDRYDSDEVDHTAAGPGFGLAQDNTDLTTVGPDGDTTEVCVYEKYFVPLEVGNEIQGDGITWQLTVRAEQARNNEDPFGATATGGGGGGGVSPSISFPSQSPQPP